MQSSTRTLALAAVLVAAAAAAGAETTSCTVIAALPYTISQPGAYCLTKNLNDPAAPVNGITVNADAVVIDLNGFTLGSASGGTGTTRNGIFSAGHKSITVKNGRIYGFLRGVYLTGATAGNHVVEDVRADRNTFVGISVEGPGCVARNNQVSSTAGTTTVANPDAVGIEVRGAGARVIDNDVTDTAGSGSGVASSILLTNAPGAVVENNRVGNASLAVGSYGIAASGGSDTLIVGNRVSVADTGVAFINGADGKYRDNLTNSVNTSYAGGTDAGNNQ